MHDNYDKEHPPCGTIKCVSIRNRLTPPRPPIHPPTYTPKDVIYHDDIW
jgi:hypothetical protein